MSTRRKSFYLMLISNGVKTIQTSSETMPTSLADSSVARMLHTSNTPMLSWRLVQLVAWSTAHLQIKSDAERQHGIIQEMKSNLMFHSMEWITMETTQWVWLMLFLLIDFHHSAVQLLVELHSTFMALVWTPLFLKKLKSWSSSELLILTMSTNL